LYLKNLSLNTASLKTHKRDVQEEKDDALAAALKPSPTGIQASPLFKAESSRLKVGQLYCKLDHGKKEGYFD
jgi:hypothetical protein